MNNFDQWRPWDCGIETDTGTHGVWACFSEHLLTSHPCHLRLHAPLLCVASLPAYRRLARRHASESGYQSIWSELLGER